MNEQTKPNAVRDNFDELSKTYSDESRRRMVPCFDDFYMTGVSMLTAKTQKPRILDLGAGTGLYAAFLLDRYPAASLTLVDFSEEMLSLARARFAGNAGVNYIVGDYTTADVGSGFDIIISALSIHHLDANGKAALFRRVFDLMNPGGEFLNADLVLCTHPAIQSRYEELWLSYAENHGLPGEYIARARKSMVLDNPSPTDGQLAWLRGAGFTEAECVYKHWNFAVFYAKK
jgi:tRNA (cmo5U34)-methyltransferase